MDIVQAVVSVLLFFVLFFGISFIANMLFRKTWLLAIVYPVIVLTIIDNISVWKYFTQFSTSIQLAFENLFKLQVMDVIILSSGLAGAIVSGIVIKMLRVRGYQMF